MCSLRYQNQSSLSLFFSTQSRVFSAIHHNACFPVLLIIFVVFFFFSTSFWQHVTPIKQISLNDPIDADTAVMPISQYFQLFLT